MIIQCQRLGCDERATRSIKAPSMVAIYTCDRHQQHAEDWLINKINEEPQSEVINEPKDSRND